MSSTTLASALGAFLGLSAPLPVHHVHPPTVPENPSLCRMEEVARLPLQMTGYYLTTPAQLDGGALSLIVDTGSQGSLLTPDAVSRFRLEADPEASVMIAGADGRGHEVPVMPVSSLRLGRLHLTDIDFPLGALPGLPIIHPPVQGLLGMNVLGIFDVEMDLPHHQLALWEVRRNSAICPAPPRWAGQWTEVPARVAGGRFFIPFMLDGHRGVALLDSGARSHILSTSFAHRLGVTDATLARDPGGMSGGVDSRESIYRWHHFHSLTIAGQTRPNPVLTVAPLRDQADMLLGADWFATHKVWLSTDTPNGAGQVFVQDYTPARIQENKNK